MEDNEAAPPEQQQFGASVDLPPSDEDAPDTLCPLCSLPDVELEHSNTSFNRNGYIRRIMASELMASGQIPSHVIYNRIARLYNRHVFKPMRQSGLDCERWTGALVKEHFEKHVNCVPRRVLHQWIKRFEKTATLVDQEIALGSQNGPNDADQLVCPKLVKKQIDLGKASLALVTAYKQAVKDDMLTCGVDALCRSVELGATTATEARELLDRAALIQSAAGAGDRPSASDLFAE